MTSITKELRELAADQLLGCASQKVHAEVITAIADRIDAELAEHYVELPLDADGEYIHIGDVMAYADGNTCPLPVVALVPPAVFLTDDGPRYADMCRHAPDTWERIIEDARTCTGSAGNYTAVPSMRWTSEVDALVARCKALAGGAS